MYSACMVLYIHDRAYTNFIVDYNRCGDMWNNHQCKGEHSRMNINQFLSNKWNILGIFLMSYFFIGCLLEVLDVSIRNIFILFIFMYIGNFASYLWGMSKGIMFATTQRPNFIKVLEKMNEMIREETRSTSNKKRTKSSKKKKGCGSGGCKNC